MSKPIVATDPVGIIEAVRAELGSAASSLYMPPEKREDAPVGAFYMTDKFRWAHHSHEHVLAAITNLNTMESELREIQHRLFRMGMTHKDEVTSAAMLALSERVSAVIRKPIELGWNNLDDDGCEVCLKPIDDCTCAPCSVCGWVGDLNCNKNHMKGDEA